MKTIVKIVITVLVILNISCGTIKPNIIIGPTGDTQKTYIENVRYYNNIINQPRYKVKIRSNDT